MMDANIKTPQDALEWLDRSIREEAELDGEMSNAHAIQLGFIQNMLAKFPRRNCDRFATVDEALKAQEQMFNNSNFANGECKLGCPECDNPRVGCKIAWLFAPATEKEGANYGNE
jgi:hypothetical protein